ncbi:MAG: glycosyltransferase family 39 protein [Nanoarchaeota archaeon]|nr:glycosyltransferase family 39 protein [Nanoarchaeota archaeon]
MFKKDLIKEKKTKIKDWFKDNYNLTFFLIFCLLIIYKLYWFFKLGNQPLWWDEADYMNIARVWAGTSIEWTISPVRPVLLSAIISIFMFFGLGEVSTRIFILLCSTVSIPLLYGIGKLFFSKRVALISAFILATFWTFNFYSYRILVDVPVTMLWLATIYFFFDAYFKDKSWKHFILPGIFLGLSFLMKQSSVILVLVLGFYLLTTEKFKIFKDKKIITFFIVSLLVVMPFFIYQYMNFGNPMQFNKTGAETGNPHRNDLSDNLKSLIRQVPFILNKIYSLFKYILFFGLFSLMSNIFLLREQISIKKTKTNNYYFLILWIVFSLIFFAKLVSSDTSYLDERYYFVFYPAIFLICGVGFEYIYKILKKYSKELSIIIIIGILLFGAFQNIAHANEIIKIRKDSFIQSKLAGEFINQNTNPEDIIFILEEQAEVTYYSKRNFVHINKETSKSIQEKLKIHKPKYIVMSFYYSLGNNFSYDIINFVFANSQIFKPVQAYAPYLDKDNTIPTAIIFKVSPNQGILDNNNYLRAFDTSSGYILSEKELIRLSEIWGK